MTPTTDPIETAYRLMRGLLCGGAYIGADLCGANLREANLRWANLSKADLRWADLSEADLCGADLSGADLSGADLSGADLCGANLREANLSGAAIDSALSGPERAALLRQVAEHALAAPDALDMSDWHTCATIHCIAGWATTLHPQGKEMEAALGSQIAGLMLLGPEAHSHFWDRTDDARDWLKGVLEDAPTTQQEQTP